jgi:hypothetical protein
MVIKIGHNVDSHQMDKCTMVAPFPKANTTFDPLPLTAESNKTSKRQNNLN